MKMDPNIRVKTDRRHQTLYNQLRNVAVGDSHELFFLCACLGYREKAPKALGKNGDPRFWSGTISPEEWCCFYAMMLEESGMDFKAIQDDGKVMTRMEEYANGGMEILIERVLGEYINSDEAQVSIDESASKELPKLLLNHIFVEAFASSSR